MNENGRELEVKEGSIVLAEVRTGRYIGEVTEFYGPRAVVKVLAVVKHPEQGDLHHPYDPDVPLFHERRALAYTEKTTVPLRDVKPYGGEVPEYRDSLKRALLEQIALHERMRRWTERSIEQLERLRGDYKLD